MRAVMMCAVVLLATPVAAQTIKPLPGDRAVVKQEMWGCVKSVHDRLTELAVDRAAFGKALADASRAGRCRAFKPATVVFVEDAELFAQISKIRAAGETTSWWVTSPTLYASAERLN